MEAVPGPRFSAGALDDAEVPSTMMLRVLASAAIGFSAFALGGPTTDAFPASAAEKGTEAVHSKAREWESDVSCTRPSDDSSLTVHGPAKESRVDNCVRAYCAEVKEGLRVCLCQLDSPDEGKLVIERDGMQIQSIKTEVFGWIGPIGPAIDVLTGDLDGDRELELIVPHLLTVSNGMPRAFWSIAIFHLGSLEKAPVELPIAEYGRHGTFLRPAGGGPCRVLSTDWVWDSEPERGRGLYLVGRWHSYRDGQMIPDNQRPVLARRLLYSFLRQWESAAGDPWQESETPFRWLRDPRTEVRTELNPRGRE